MAPSSLNTALLYTEAATRGVLWEKVFHNISEAAVRRCSVEKVFLEISQNSQEDTCVRVSFLIKLQASGLRPATLLKKRLWRRCFPVNFVKFLRTSFLQNTSGGCFFLYSNFQIAISHYFPVPNCREGEGNCNGRDRLVQ